METNLARKLAWSFHHTTGLEFEDLYQEACLAYCWAERDSNYDPRKAAFTSFAYMCMRSHLCNIVTKCRADASRRFPTDTIALLNDWEAIDNAPAPDEELEFREQLGELSKEARFVIRLVFESPHEYLCLTSREAQAKIRQYLRDQGWSWVDIQKTLKEIKGLLRQTD